MTHYGRHGARYMTGDEHYEYTIAKMDTARSLGLLTPYGEDVLRRLNIAAEDARQRAGYAQNDLYGLRIARNRKASGFGDKHRRVYVFRMSQASNGATAG